MKAGTVIGTFPKNVKENRFLSLPISECRAVQVTSNNKSIKQLIDGAEHSETAVKNETLISE